ncbi:dienelactone hydrolase family protein [Methylobacterium nodulans]|uniref:Dienelactone hydrolase n=1 Tax=Methylobacterium nodulans (strain LMG 21967 / CNCM I-2342 / ORS 2060) TaxID=460265 RepID=B8IB84_METNO|nr:dienelactone hydrolase family protein [Methylobacterium nodulans]ACL57299.1 dienelactone hydrolase [Methylobacterium nodulans ORS 2060]
MDGPFDLTEHQVAIAADSVALDATLCQPGGAHGVVLFAHGSGSSRFSPRNRSVARRLNEAGFATVLADLLTPDEERIDRSTGHLRFDIGFLAGRLCIISDWLADQPTLSNLPCGLFGASTGAGAALLAATARPRRVGAVVSRGGRPDLAGAALSRVAAPTLLIIGGNDVEVLKLNQAALSQLCCVKQLAVVPGATHLFEEPGALDRVARLARDWFQQHLRADRP